MTTLLVLTVGGTDVQLVLDGVRHTLTKECGALHDEIERRGYQLVDAPRARAHDWMKVLPEGELALCTPKLDAVLRYIGGNSSTTSALIFDTRRTRDDDPRLAGPALLRRLQERGVKEVRCHTLLTGNERLEDSNHRQDAVVRRKVVEGIAEALAERFAAIQPDIVVVATTGGIPAANSVIEAVVRLRAVGRSSVQVVRVPDATFIERHDEVVPERFQPAIGILARWRALSLIEGGNLLGAWGAVSHLVDKPGQDWTKVIDWLRCFASSLPMPSNCDVVVLEHPRMAVRAALRVELALRANDIPRAVHGTVAFFEAALWDGLNERLERHPERRRLFRFKTGKDPRGAELLRQGKGAFKLKPLGDDVAWCQVDTGGGGSSTWLAKHFLRRDALLAFDEALGSGIDSIRDLRNDVAHNEPTPEVMANASAQMQTATLWSGENTFLTQPLVHAVLLELGEPEGSELLISLLADVRHRLLTLNPQAP